MKKEGYPLDWLAELKKRNDIVTTISRYVPLKMQSGRYWACCPFHHEKTPSFAINQQDGFYHCFGCHESGDVITFVQKMENLTFPETVNLLAERAGMEMPDTVETEGAMLAKKKRLRLYELTKEAARRYYENLIDKNIGKAAMDYLIGRGITPQIIVKFGLGYSNGYDDIVYHLRSKGYSDSEIIESGVGMRKNDKVFDYLANRLIVPVIDQRGRVVAFGGRVIEKEYKGGKYVNTNTTPIFKKGTELFNANLVKKLKQKTGITEVILVEGYMDVISLSKIGVNNVVAGMGTAFTDMQARAIGYLNENVYVCYDGDDAGITNTKKNIDILKNAGLNVKVISLPSDMDPDDVANKYGYNGFKKMFDDALPIIDYKLKIIEDVCDLSTPSGRANYVAGALEILKTIDNTAEREVYYGVVHTKSFVSVDILRKQFSGEMAVVQPKIQYLTPATDKPKATQVEITAAEFVLSSLIKNKEYARISEVRAEWFFIDDHKLIYDYLIKTADAGGKPSAGMLFEFMDSSEEMMAVLNFVPNVTGEIAERLMYEKSIARLKSRYAKEQIKILTAQYEDAKDKPDAERADILRKIKEFQALVVR